MRRHLLVTNDFPPKIGGIQNYLWELWRRLDPEVAAVYCTPHAGSVAFDAAQRFRIERSPEPVLLPYPWLASRVRQFADELSAELVLLDPAVPLGLLGPMLDRPYGVVLHGAEVTIPSRMPGTRRLLGNVLSGASLVVSAGQYALTEAEKCVGHQLPSVVVPPGVDTERFIPAGESERAARRSALGVADDEHLVSCVTRLVPRKGMHTLVAAAGLLIDRGLPIRLIVGGTGREADRLRRLSDDVGAHAVFPGRLDDRQVVELYQASDLMVMPCTKRWGGLEQEGFGIVFLEAAATGVPQIAGRSGGADEAVLDGVTGLVLDNPDDPGRLAEAMADLLTDPDRLHSMSVSSRQRVVDDFGYQPSADRLQLAIDSCTSNP